MIRLTQICLIVFLGTLALYLYQLHEHKDYTLAFLMMGAAGCVYMLLRMEHRYTLMNQRKTKLTEAYRNPPAKRVAPKVAATTPLVERKPIPVISRAHEAQVGARKVSIK